MQIRKWLALLVSAALALSLLAGCGGKNQSLAQVILDLLDGQYANVAVEIDPDLEADLRQAVHEGETDEEIRAALEKILGSGVSFRLIGDGQQGDTAWNLILYPGSDPDAAARSAFTEWSKVFGSLPRDGQYSAQIAMIETENGYAILVQATVDKAASRDDDDDDDDEPEEPEDPGYTDDGKGNYTVNDSDGLQELFTKEWSKASTAIITLPEGEYNISGTFGNKDTPFTGTLQGKSPDKKATINITSGNGLFEQISGGTVKNITFNVQTAISNTYTDSETTRAGAVAGQNNGTIQNCDVTINAGYSITANGGESDDVYAGGIAGENQGTISNCDVTIKAGDSISITAANGSGYVCAGGIAGENHGTISNCHVNGGNTAPDANASADISANNEDVGNTCAGGIAGCNRGDTGTVKDCFVSHCKIEAGDNGSKIAAGGLVGLNENDSMPSTSVTDYYITATALTGTSATVASSSDESSTALDPQTGVCAGTGIGDNNGGGPVGL